MGRILTGENGKSILEKAIVGENVEGLGRAGCSNHFTWFKLLQKRGESGEVVG